MCLSHRQCRNDCLLTLVSKSFALCSRSEIRPFPLVTEAKQKMWFGCLESFSTLDQNWSILEEALCVLNNDHLVFGADVAIFRAY